ncbi:hypothetical protein [Longimicrobium sp.]|uniref:hypothetical protein n=1 Tax=Longimicrobium sp. TaxID=2029185 RepID=UPI002ED8143D
MTFCMSLRCSALVLAMGCDSGATDAHDGPPAISVDFGEPGADVRSMVGFLHSVGPGSAPESLVLPLRPRLLRGGAQGSEALVARAAGTAVERMLVLSDLWGYPHQGYPNRGGRAPFEDYPAWEAFVRGLAGATRGQDLVYEVWNEPDQPFFWNGSMDQYAETFRRAERVLRDELGAAVRVAGPGIAHWDEDQVRGFLDYQRRAGSRVDVLTWHEFQLDSNLPRIEASLRRARSAYVSATAYRDVGIREIFIGETLAEADVHRPGPVLGTLYFLERGGADAAARACYGSCFDGSLNGLLTEEGLPRAAWWAYRAYAETLTGRVPVRVRGAGVAAFAAHGPAGRAASVVVGRFSDESYGLFATVELRLKGLDRLTGARRGVVRIVVRKVPATGTAPLADLPVEWEETREVEKSTTIELTAVGVGEGRVVSISAP